MLLARRSSLFRFSSPLLYCNRSLTSRFTSLARPAPRTRQHTTPLTYSSEVATRRSFCAQNSPSEPIQPLNADNEINDLNYSFSTFYKYPAPELIPYFFLGRLLAIRKGDIPTMIYPFEMVLSFCYERYPHRIKDIVGTILESFAKDREELDTMRASTTDADELDQLENQEKLLHDAEYAVIMSLLMVNYIPEAKLLRRQLVKSGSEPASEDDKAFKLSFVPKKTAKQVAEVFENETRKPNYDNPDLLAFDTLAITDVLYTTSVLDKWWSLFYLSGETKWVESILLAMQMASEEFKMNGVTLSILKDDPESVVKRFGSDPKDNCKYFKRLGVWRTGWWSLRCNAYQHPKVLKACEHALANKVGPKRYASFWEKLEQEVQEIKARIEKEPWKYSATGTKAKLELDGPDEQSKELAYACLPMGAPVSINPSNRIPPTLGPRGEHLLTWRGPEHEKYVSPIGLGESGVMVTEAAIEAAKKIMMRYESYGDIHFQTSEEEMNVKQEMKALCEVFETVLWIGLASKIDRHAFVGVMHVGARIFEFAYRLKLPISVHAKGTKGIQDRIMSVQFYKLMLDLSPNEKDYWYELGLIYHTVKDHHESAECLKKTLDILGYDLETCTLKDESVKDMDLFRNTMLLYVNALVSMKDLLKAHDTLTGWHKVAPEDESCTETLQNLNQDLERLRKEAMQPNNQGKE